MDDDYEWLEFYLDKQVLAQIDSWRKAQRPAIEDRSMAIAKLIDISQPPPWQDAEKVRVTIVGPTVEKVWKYGREEAKDIDHAAQALLMLGLQQERERNYERIIASYEEDPATPEIEFDEDGEPLELEECIDEGPFDQ